MNENLEGRPRSDSAEIAFRKIFIGGLSYSTDEEKLKKYFKTYGMVQDAVVMKDPVSKRSRGFGFITFYDIASVDNALAHEPHTIDSRKVEAKRAVPRSEINRENAAAAAAAAQKLSIPPPPGTPGSNNRTANTTPTSSPQFSSNKTMGITPSTPPSMYDSKHAMDPKINSDEYAYNKIFVGGLHYDTRDPDFRSYFEKYGRVISAEVMFNRETHKSRGFGFIVFEFEESAINVCTEKEHIIDGKAVEVKRAIPRSKIGTSTGTGSPPQSTNLSINAAINAANIRTDVRRTLSAGNAQAMSSLSGNSSTLVASTTSVNQPKINASPASTTNRKQMSSQAIPVATNTTSAAKSVTSYAAALKSGNNAENPTLDILHHLNHSSQIDDNNLNSMYPPLGSQLDMVRPNRAQSEPIVKFDNSPGKNGFELPSPFNLPQQQTSPQNGLLSQKPLSSNDLAGASAMNFPNTGMSWLAVATSSFDNSNQVLGMNLSPQQQYQHQQRMLQEAASKSPNMMGYNNVFNAAAALHNQQMQLAAAQMHLNEQQRQFAAMQQLQQQQMNQQLAFGHAVNSQALLGANHLASNDQGLFGSPSRGNNSGLFGATSNVADVNRAVPSSPEAWSSLVAGLGGSSSATANSLHQPQVPQPSLPAASSQQQPQQSGYYTLLNDSNTWGSSNTSAAASDPFTGNFQNFSDTALFLEGSNTYRQRSASRDENGSLILGITQQARSSRSNSEVDFLVAPVQRKVSHDFLDGTSTSQFGSLRLDSTTNASTTTSSNTDFVVDANASSIWSTPRR